MENQNTNIPNNPGPQQTPIEARKPELTPKAKTDTLGVISVILAVFLPPVGFVLGLIGANKAKKENRSPAVSRIGWILGLLISIPLIIFLILWGLLAAFGRAVDHGDTGGPPAKVKSAYIRAADKMARTTTQNVDGSKLFYSTQIALDPNKSLRNEIEKQYCFITDNSPNIISGILNGFLNEINDKSAYWQPPADTPDGNYSFVDVPDNSGFINYYKKQLVSSGTIDFNLSTDPNAYDGKPIKTDNPAYYPEGTANIEISLPSQNNMCDNLAKQKHLNTSNKYILAITLDFDDYQPQLP